MPQWLAGSPLACIARLPPAGRVPAGALPQPPSLPYRLVCAGTSERQLYREVFRHSLPFTMQCGATTGKGVLAKMDCWTPEGGCVGLATRPSGAPSDRRATVCCCPSYSGAHWLLQGCVKPHWRSKQGSSRSVSWAPSSWPDGTRGSRALAPCLMIPSALTGRCSPPSWLYLAAGQRSWTHVATGICCLQMEARELHALTTACAFSEVVAGPCCAHALGSVATHISLSASRQYLHTIALAWDVVCSGLRFDTSGSISTVVKYLVGICAGAVCMR